MQGLMGLLFLSSFAHTRNCPRRERLLRFGNNITLSQESLLYYVSAHTKPATKEQRTAVCENAAHATIPCDGLSIISQIEMPDEPLMLINLV